VSELAEQATNPGVAFSDAPGLPLPGGLVVARTDAGPGGQPIHRAEGIHVVADLDQQQGGANGVNAGDGLHQRQGGPIGL
jgi:hypothetical protein